MGPRLYFAVSRLAEIPAGFRVHFNYTEHGQNAIVACKITLTGSYWFVLSCGWEPEDAILGAIDQFHAARKLLAMHEEEQFRTAVRGTTKETR